MHTLAARLFAVAATFGTIGYWAGGLAQNTQATRIEVVAAKYAFSQTELRLKKGRAVTLVLSSADFPHGFSVPDFNVRADIIPGKSASVTITPDRAGKFPFLCDNFCGEGHDRMSGFLIVED